MGHGTPVEASGVLSKAEKFLCASYVLLFCFYVPNVFLAFLHNSVNVIARG